MSSQKGDRNNISSVAEPVVRISVPRYDVYVSLKYMCTAFRLWNYSKPFNTDARPS
jgi:hypothetical protein